MLFFFCLQGIQNEKTKVQVDSDRAILVDSEAAEQQVDPDKHIPFHNRYRLHMKASIYSKDGSKGKGDYDYVYVSQEGGEKVLVRGVRAEVPPAAEHAETPADSCCSQYIATTLQYPNLL